MINNDNLISAVGVDYSYLRDLLAAQKWKEADEETVYKLKEVLGREHIVHILFADIKGFFCEDLLTIDQLWLKYSKGRFGLSVQKRIWEIVYRDWKKLGDRVGWRTDGKWMYRDELNYTLNAPPDTSQLVYGVSSGFSLSLTIAGLLAAPKRIGCCGSYTDRPVERSFSFKGLSIVVCARREGDLPGERSSNSSSP